MAQRCQVCAHPRVQEVDQALRGKHNVSHLALELGVSRQSFRRHRDNHVLALGPPQPAAATVPPPSHQPAPEPPAAPPPPLPPTETADPQTAFLTSYAASGDLKQALADAGATRPTLRKWQEHDEAFVLRFHQAEVEAIEVLEAEARVRAVAGSRMVRRVFRQGLLYEEIHEYRPSDAMLVKLLQAHKPDKYGDKLTVTQTTVVKAIDAEAWESV